MKTGLYIEDQDGKMVLIEPVTSNKLPDTMRNPMKADARLRLLALQKKFPNENFSENDEVVTDWLEFYRKMKGFKSRNAPLPNGPRGGPIPS